MNRILKLGLLSVIVGALYSCSSDSLYDPDKAGVDCSINAEIGW